MRAASAPPARAADNAGLDRQPQVSSFTSGHVLESALLNDPIAAAFHAALKGVEGPQRLETAGTVKALRTFFGEHAKYPLIMSELQKAGLAGVAVSSGLELDDFRRLFRQLDLRLRPPAGLQEQAQASEPSSAPATDLADRALQQPLSTQVAQAPEQLPPLKLPASHVGPLAAGPLGRDRLQGGGQLEPVAAQGECCHNCGPLLSELHSLREELGRIGAATAACAAAVSSAGRAERSVAGLAGTSQPSPTHRSPSARNDTLQRDDGSGGGFCLSGSGGVIPFERSGRLREQVAIEADQLISYTEIWPSLEVTVEIREILQLNLPNQSFEARICVQLDWVDTEMKEGVHYYLDKRAVPPRFVLCSAAAAGFNPKVYIDNTDDSAMLEEHLSDKQPRLHRIVRGVRGSSAEVPWLTKTFVFRGVFLCPNVDAVYFPFDIQRLPIRLKSQPLVGPAAGQLRWIQLRDPHLRPAERLTLKLRKEQEHERKESGVKQERSSWRQNDTPAPTAHRPAAISKTEPLVLRRDDDWRDQMEQTPHHVWGIFEFTGSVRQKSQSTNPRLKVGDMSVVGFGGTYLPHDRSQYHVEVVVARLWKQYAFDFLVLAFLVLLALSSVMVPFDSETIPNRLSISLTVLLTLVAYTNQRPSAIDGLAYSTRHDQFEMCMVFAAVFVGLENTIVYRLCSTILLEKEVCQDEITGTSQIDLYFGSGVLLYLCIVVLTFLVDAQSRRLRTFLDIESDLSLSKKSKLVTRTTNSRLMVAQKDKKTKEISLVRTWNDKDIVRSLSLWNMCFFKCVVRLLLKIERLGHKLPRLCRRARAQARAAVNLANLDEEDDESTDDLGSEEDEDSPMRSFSTHKGRRFHRGAKGRGSTLISPKLTQSLQLLRQDPDNVMRIIDAGTGEMKFYTLRSDGKEGLTVAGIRDEEKVQLQRGELPFQEYLKAGGVMDLVIVLLTRFPDLRDISFKASDKALIDEGGDSSRSRQEDASEPVARPGHVRGFRAGLKMMQLKLLGSPRSPRDDNDGDYAPNQPLNQISLPEENESQSFTLGRRLQNSKEKPQPRRILVGLTGVDTEASGWSDRHENLRGLFKKVGQKLEDEIGVPVEVLLEVMGSQDEAACEFVAVEWLVKSANWLELFDAEPTRATSFVTGLAHVELQQAFESLSARAADHARTRQKSDNGSAMLTLPELLSEFKDLGNMRDDLTNVYQAAVRRRSDATEAGAADAALLQDAFRRNVPLMRAFLRARLFTGVLGVSSNRCILSRYNGDSAQNSVQHIDYFTLKFGTLTPTSSPGVLKQPWSAEAVPSRNQVEEWKAFVRDNMVGADFPQGERGLFVGITRIYRAAKEAGCADTLMPCEQLVDALDRRLQELLAQPAPKKVSSRVRDLANLVRDVANLALVSQFLRTALNRMTWVVCKREWKGTQGQDYVATWSLGLHLMPDVAPAAAEEDAESPYE